MSTVIFYIILPSLLAIVILLYYSKPNLSRYFNKLPSVVKQEVENIDVNSLEVFLYDDITGLPDFKILSGEIIESIKKEYGNLGQLWDGDNKKTYDINRYRLSGSDVDHYRPVQALMSQTRDNPPEDIYDCTCQDDTKIVNDTSAAHSGIMQNWGAIIWFCLAAMGILFIWGASILK